MRAPTQPRRSAAEHADQVARLLIEALADRTTETVVVADLLAAARDAAALAPRTLARDARAALALPGFDNSQMDGYAVRSADLAAATRAAPVRLPVAPAVPAGSAPALHAPRTATPVMTGAPLPPGADAVVRVEDADPPTFGAGPGGGVTVTAVAFTAPVTPGTYVRATGSDVAAGDVVVAAGTPLGPAQLGALVASGVTEIQAWAPPHVLVLSTGSELAPAGQPLGRAQVYDANGAALAAALAQIGCRATTRAVPDDPTTLRTTLADAHGVDLVLTTGGVSAGAYEVVRETFDDAWFGSVAMQPGGPQGLGHVHAGRRTVPLIAFPGNPVSALISFELFLRPLLARATGAVPAARPARRAPLAEPLDSPPALLQVRRGRLDDDGHVHLVGGPGSHLLAHLAAATVLVHVPPGVARLDAGDVVDLWEIS